MSDLSRLLGLPEPDPGMRRRAWEAAMAGAPVSSLEAEAYWALLMFGECCPGVSILTMWLRIFSGIDPHVTTTPADVEAASVAIARALGAL